MRRLLSLVLALAVAASSSAVSSLHVHAYGGGHDHSEHQHGPASHGHGHQHGQPVAVDHDHDDHQVIGHDRDAPVVHLEACDPGGHAIRLPMGCASVPQFHLQLAVLPAPIIVAPGAPVQVALAVTDVRVHGPPFDARIPARAPPLTLLA